MEYDNPGCIFVRDGKLMDIPYTVREIEGKKIREYRFQVKLKDCFVLMSDGVIYAGVGELLNFGWTWESMADYTVKCTMDNTFGQASGSDAVPGLRRPVYAETGRRYNSGGSKSH